MLLINLISYFTRFDFAFGDEIKTVFVSYNEKEMTDANNQLEEEANNFATNFLISPVAMKKFAPTKYTSDDEIIAFARSITLFSTEYIFI